MVGALGIEKNVLSAVSGILDLLIFQMLNSLNCTYTMVFSSTGEKRIEFI